MRSNQQPGRESWRFLNCDTPQGPGSLCQMSEIRVRSLEKLTAGVGGDERIKTVVGINGRSGGPGNDQRKVLLVGVGASRWLKEVSTSRFYHRSDRIELITAVS